MEADFRAILTDHAPLTALVPAVRIYPNYYPQGASDPSLRITKVSGLVGVHMSGSDGLTESRMQIDIRTRAEPGSVEVTAIRNVLLALLHTYRGPKGSTFFQVISLSMDRGVNFEKPTTIEYLTASLDFDVWSKAA